MKRHVKSPRKSPRKSLVKSPGGGGSSRPEHREEQQQPAAVEDGTLVHDIERLVEIAMHMSTSEDTMMGLDMTKTGDNVKGVMRHKGLASYIKRSGRNVGKFILSTIILMIGALYQTPKAAENEDPDNFAFPFINAFCFFIHIIMEVPITERSLKIVSDAWTFLLDLGLFTHLARYIVSIKKGCKVYLEAILFISLFTVEMVLKGCCYIFTTTNSSSLLVSRVIKELGRSTLLTTIFKELSELPPCIHFNWRKRIDSICIMLARFATRHTPTGDISLELSIALNSEGMQGLCIAILISLTLILDLYDAAGLNGLPSSTPLLQRMTASQANASSSNASSSSSDAENNAFMIKVYVILLRVTMIRNARGETAQTTKGKLLITKKRLSYICKRIMDLPEGTFDAEVLADLKSYIQPNGTTTTTSDPNVRLLLQ
jgi:hypothetical protein